MKIILMSLLMVLTAGINSAHACPDPVGIEGVGCGGGLLCCNGEKKFVRLLDFWGADSLHNIKIVNSFTGVIPIARVGFANQAYCGRNNSISYEECLSQLSSITAQIWDMDALYSNFIPPGKHMSAPRDTLSTSWGENCVPVGVAEYNDRTRKLRMDREYIDLIGSDMGGLMFHEVIYRFLRMRFQVKNSVAARAITACMFADEICPEISPTFGIRDWGPLFECTLEVAKPGQQSKLAVFPRQAYTNDSWWGFQIVANGSEELSSRTFFDLPLGTSTEYVGGYLNASVFSSEIVELNLAYFEDFEDFTVHRAFEKGEPTTLSGSFDRRALSCQRVR